MDSDVIVINNVPSDVITRIHRYVSLAMDTVGYLYASNIDAILKEACNLTFPGISDMPIGYGWTLKEDGVGSDIVDGNYFDHTLIFKKPHHILPRKNKSIEHATTLNDIPRNRGDILDLAKETTCHARQNQYGEPEDSFDAISSYWTLYIRSKYPEFTKVLSREDVAWMMNLLKIARQACGEGKLDNFVDAAAYAAIAGEMWDKS